MTPEVCSVHVKNTEYRYRWVNRHSQAGRIYQQRLSQGFVNATKDDVDVLGGDAVATSADITAGDVILMKIRADLYDAAIKANMQQAYTLARTRGVYLEGASSDVNSDVSPTKMSVAQEPFARAGAAKPFIPENADAIVDDSISSGRVEGSRKTISDIRENIKAGKPARS
jgi:hypothetical protein